MSRTSKTLFIATLFILLAAAMWLRAGDPTFANAYEDLVSQAKTLFKDGRTNDALAKVKEIEDLGLNEGLGESSFIAGNCWAKKGDNANALKCFEIAAGDTDFILKDFARFSLARTYEKLGKDGSAEAEYERLIVESPNSSLASNSLLYMGKKMSARGNYKGAIELFDLIIYAPEEVSLIEEAKFEKARCLEALGKLKEAGSVYFDIIFYHPRGALLKDSKARLASLVKRTKIPYPRATAEEAFNRAMSYFDSGDFASASSEFFQFLKSYPSSPLASKARLRLGVSEYKRGKYPTASYHLKRIIASGASGADEAQFYLSFTYGKSRNMKGAIASLRKVTTYYPRSPFAEEACYYIAYYYEINGFAAKAVDEYLALLVKYPESGYADDAIWRIGRYYYNARNYERAFEMFSKASDLPPDDFTSYCLFWQAMAAEKLGRTDEAKGSYLKVLKEFDHTYQSYRARERLKVLGASDDDIEFAEVSRPEPYSPSWSDQADASSIDEEIKTGSDENIRVHLKKYDELMSLGLSSLALGEALYLRENMPGSQKEKGQILYYFAKHQNGEYKEPLIFAEKRYIEAIRDNELSDYDQKIWMLAFPRAFWGHVLRYSLEYKLDPYLVLAVMREESRFNPMVLSWARAHGLMQIIPSTGRGVARLIGIRPYYTYRLFEPELNIKMGCYYLSSLLKRFNGNPYLALAGYNGGPVRVKTWVTKWQRDKGELDIDEFVEVIPLRETRRYVQKVMNSYLEYKRIYDRNAGEAPLTGGG